MNVIQDVVITESRPNSMSKNETYLENVKRNLILSPQISPVRYTCQPTGTSCLSSRRPATLAASPTQSPTKTTATITGSTSIGSRRGSRKHVQFPDFDVPNLKSSDLLHANWKQGSSPPPENCICQTGITYYTIIYI